MKKLNNTTPILVQQWEELGNLDPITKRKPDFFLEHLTNLIIYITALNH